MSNERKGLREEMGEGYLSLLDSVRHSFEQAAWGQEATGNLADDFYRWVGPADTSKPQEAGRDGGGEVALDASLEEYDEFALWIDEVPVVTIEAPAIEPDLGRDGPELGD